MNEKFTVEQSEESLRAAEGRVWECSLDVHG